MEKNERKKVTILSCCGGGTRGIIPSLILDKISEITGKHPTDLFDIMIGSSTGAIITTILNIPNNKVIDITLTEYNDQGKQGETVVLESIKPWEKLPKYNTQDLIHIYQNEARNTLESSLWKRISTMNGLYGAMFSTTIRDVKFNEWVGDINLSDTLTDMIITSYDMCTQEPVFFKTRKAKAEKGRDYLLQDVLKASTAAPTIWPPYNFNDTLYMDALYAKNPTLFGVIEALKHYSVQPQDIHVLSIGTGISENKYNIKQITTTGLEYLSNVFDSTLISNNASTLYITKLLIGSSNILRLDLPLDNSLLGTCDFSKKTIDEIKDKTTEYINENIEAIQEFAKLLS
jgi:patatin-like phospholipase/acyl hydrolase